MSPASVPPVKEEGGSSLMTFWDHLEELRGRLIKAALWLVAGFSIGYIFIKPLREFLISSFFPENVNSLAYLNPTEGFIVSLKLALMIGLVIASPGVFYQFWRFVAPGLYPKEKRLLLPVVIISSVCFFTGVVFSFFTLPYATKFFLSFASNNVQNLWSFGSYIDFIVRLMLAFGVVFELPLLIYFLVRLGVVTVEFLRKQRRYAIVINLIIAAVITPPDIFTMIVLAIPLLALYEISIWVAIFTQRRRQKRLAAETES